MKFHISTSIEGLLAQSDYQLKKLIPYIRYDGKGFQSVYELRRLLISELLSGKKFIASDGCNNFDPVKGCLGHSSEEETVNGGD